MREAYVWAALHKALNLEQRDLLLLYRLYRSAGTVLQLDPQVLRRTPGLKPDVAERIIQGRRVVDPLKTASELKERGIQVTTIGEPGYPRWLMEIADPPVIIYTRGRLPDCDLPLIAIVGSRRCTPYGRAVARQLAGALAGCGWGVVSGMARGIDTAAHEGALAAGGYTMAVFGCGVDVCYPVENRGLRDRIEATGCLLSELSPHAPPLPRFFPARNRIISGCTLGTVVVEAGEKSGALITARFALEQGRDVFAVPGVVTSSCCRGSNSLIKQGAKLVEQVEDILEEYPYLKQTEKRNKGNQPGARVMLSPDEERVMRCLSLEPVQIDQLARLTGLSVSELGGLMTVLEMKGFAKRLPGQCYICSDLTLI